MDNPKVTIVFPVYNVKDYLRKALDSVTGQTLKDIQIICVNDGSTDESPEILREYASKDPRIELIDQENRGGGSARNKAFPAIRGKYTYFADSDDWMHLDLCEKTFHIAEKTESDAVYFKMRNMSNGHLFKFDAALPAVRYSKKEKKDLLLSFNSTCLKLWRSSFLINHNVFFAEGKRPMNDVIQNWRGLTQANKIAILDEPLYCRRIRSGSYQQTKDASHFIVTDAIREIENMLVATDKYEMYRDYFISFKINAFRHVYQNIMPVYRNELYIKIQNNLNEKEMIDADDFLSKTNRRFWHFIRGGSKEKLRYHFFEAMKWPEKKVRAIKKRFAHNLKNIF